METTPLREVYRSDALDAVWADDAIVKEYADSGAWGLLTSIDLHGCDPALIRDADAIKRFVEELCVRIDMKRFGPCQVVNFGEDEKVAGYSMVQLIETSNISAHIANNTDRMFLDVFSCCYYNPRVIAEFAKKFFRADNYDLQYTLRK